MTAPLRIAAVEDGTACGYYRIRLPFEEMRKHGHEMEYARTAEQFDESWPILVAQRFGYPGFELEWLKLFRKHAMVWETDDDLWAIDPVNKRAAEVFTRDYLKGLEFCVRSARLVTVTNDHLAERMSRFNPNVAVVPNMIDAALPTMNRVRRDKVTIGWAGGDSHRRDLARIVAPLHRIVRTTAAVVHTIGQDFSDVLRLPVDRHRHTGWESRLIKYYSSLDFDIGLAPIENTTFTRSKSYIKALEYGALGIPVIASDVGPYREYVEDGVTGFLVRKESEWIDRMQLLIDDADLRERMGAAAREKATRHTIAAGWPLWEQAYRRVA
ncbi:MAG TPA: glycosyltransferase family 4 protein [Microbacteriaceae bacterium]|nr:glycosyltransferase family 4 protein [Microbacteriaceae bacterium]